MKLTWDILNLLKNLQIVWLDIAFYHNQAQYFLSNQKKIRIAKV